MLPFSVAMIGRVPKPNGFRGILEIHLLDPDRRFGAFHEDILLEGGARPAKEASA